MTELPQGEIDRRNKLIEKCEALIRTRGQGTASAAIFTGGGFAIAYWAGRSGQTCLQVDCRNEPVMRVIWAEDGDPGQGFVLDGRWQADFLGLPAARLH